MNDPEVADLVRKAVGAFNHALHVAYHHGVEVVVTTVSDPVLRVSDVHIARPILPAKV